MSWLSSLFDEYTRISRMWLPVNTVWDRACQSNTHTSRSSLVLSQQFAPLHSCMSSCALTAGHIWEGIRVVAAQLLLIHGEDLVFAMQQIIATCNAYLATGWVCDTIWNRSLLVEIEHLFEHRTVIVCFVFYCAHSFHACWVALLLWSWI